MTPTYSVSMIRNLQHGGSFNHHGPCRQSLTTIMRLPLVWCLLFLMISVAILFQGRCFSSHVPFSVEFSSDYDAFIALSSHDISREYFSSSRFFFSYGFSWLNAQMLSLASPSKRALEFHFPPWKGNLRTAYALRST